MAQSLSQLQTLLSNLEYPEDTPDEAKAKHVYIQAPTSGMEYPCIMLQRGGPSVVKHADNIKYLLKKGYTAIVIDRNPHSLIPDLVEALPHSRFDRYYRTDGLHHFAFELYF